MRLRNDRQAAGITLLRHPIHGVRSHTTEILDLLREEAALRKALGEFFRQLFRGGA